MKKWRVIYRNKDGAKEEDVIEAKDRNDLFCKLKELKINAICIREFTEDKIARPTLHLNIVCKVLFLVILPILIIIIALLTYLKGIDDKKENKDFLPPKKIAQAKYPSNRKLPKPNIEHQHTNSAPVFSKRYERGVEVLSSVITTNKNGSVIERITLLDGRKIKKVSPPKALFNNPSDQLIAMAVNVKVGQSMPPFPNMVGIEEEFKKSLLTPIVIYDDDPPKVKELKSLVIEARAYLEEEVKRGTSVVDALLAYQAEVNRISDHHLMAVQEIRKIKEKYGSESAQEFARKVNEAFRARGIPEVQMFKPKTEK
jgi:hypothetical protein